MGTNYAIILAGGKGLRMGADLPKQFLLLREKPVLMHAIEAFHQVNMGLNIIVVLPLEQMAYWDALCMEHHFSIPHQVVQGGATRFDSVKNGLQLVEGDGLVAIHDGVRPLVSTTLIEACMHAAEDKGSAIPVVPVVDSLREVFGSESQSVDRSRFVAVQTPQVFQSTRIKAAYEMPYQDSFTDDASVLEAAGFALALVEGERENIKITTPLDLSVAEVYLCRT
jgi:2-C-methyl-D-erythritol 4-phosphate cytidylyltransferase